MLEKLTQITPAEFEKYLSIGQKFNNYSFKNCVFIFQQDQNASLVRSNKEWWADGYKQKKGAIWLDIFVPTRVKLFEKEIRAQDRDDFLSHKIDAETFKTRYGIKSGISVGKYDFFEADGKTFFRIMQDTFKVAERAVFDISEVEPRIDEKTGKNLAKRLNTIIEGSSIDFDTLKDKIEKKFNIQVSFRSLAALNGGFVIKWNEREIFLNANDDPLSNIGTLLHEFSHLQLWHAAEDHNKADQSSTEYQTIYGINELEAETLSYLLCKDIGIQRSNEFYIKSWMGNKDLWDEMYKDIFLKIMKFYDRIKKEFRDM